MTYRANLPQAARRHIAAADALPASRHDVAGYLYGLTAEIAIKALMQEAHIPQSKRGDAGSAPYFAHFPELVPLLRDTLSGRRSTVLSAFIRTPGLMRQWHVSMRYSSGKNITKKLADEWKETARQAVSLIGT